MINHDVENNNLVFYYITLMILIMRCVWICMCILVSRYKTQVAGHCFANTESILNIRKS